jgi:hypothetical protein
MQIVNNILQGIPKNIISIKEQCITYGKKETMNAAIGTKILVFNSEIENINFVFLIILRISSSLSRFILKGETNPTIISKGLRKVGLIFL